MPSTAQKLLFSLVTTFGLFGAAEVVVRMGPAAWTPTREALILANTKEGQLAENLDVPGWDLLVEGGIQDGIPYSVNRWHMRGPDHPEDKGPGVVRAIFAADSSIFGVTLEWDDTFTAVFEGHREARFPDVDYQVANCASPGHSSFQTLLKLERQCLDFQPDIVVLANQFSDSTNEFFADKDRFVPTKNPDLIRNLERLALFRLGNHAWWKRVGSQTRTPRQIAQVGGEQPGKDRRVSLEDYADNLRKQVEMVRGAGATPVFMVLACMKDVEPLHARKVPSSEYRAVMRATGDELGVQVVDAATWVQDKMPGKRDLFIDQVHPSESGAQLYGRLLDLQLPTPDPSGS